MRAARRVAAQPGQQAIDELLVLADELALGAPHLAATERVETRAAAITFALRNGLA